MAELTERRKREIEAMARRDLNAHAWLCEQEQEEYEAEATLLRQQVNRLKFELKLKDAELKAVDRLGVKYQQQVNTLTEALLGIKKASALYNYPVTFRINEQATIALQSIKEQP